MDEQHDELDDLIDEFTRENPAFPALMEKARQRRATMRVLDRTKRRHGRFVTSRAAVDRLRVRGASADCP